MQANAAVDNETVLDEEAVLDEYTGDMILLKSSNEFPGAGRSPRGQRQF